MKINSFSLFYSCFIVLIFFLSCAEIPVPGIAVPENAVWEEANVVRNKDMASFRAKGEMTFWVDRSKFSGDYEIFSRDKEDWRINIHGPFNMLVAVMIINGETAHVFHDDKWDTKPWKYISRETFGVSVSKKVLSAMLGGTYTISGECTVVETGTVCRENDTFYRFDGELREIRAPGFYVVFRDGRWTGVRNGRRVFVFKNFETLFQQNFDDYIFERPDKEETDIFENI